MTDFEKQEIVNLVLKALKTNSLSIEQLTSIKELPDDGYFEISGGCKISCRDLKQVFKSFLPGIDLVGSFGNRIDAVITQAFFTKKVQETNKHLTKITPVFLSEYEYEDLAVKDPDTTYMIYEEE